MLLLSRISCLLYIIMMVTAYKKLRGRVSDIQGKIVGGRNAKIKDFPYMVRLLISLDAMMIGCGGSYIRPLWVMTAAHCLDSNDHNPSLPPNVGSDMSRVDSVMGMENKQDSKYQVIKSKDLFINPDYFRNDTEVLNDVGLIQLQRPFDLTTKVQIIATPTSKIDYSNYKVTIIGWGATGIQDTGSSITRPTTLQMLTTFAHDMEDCQDMTGSDSAICIGQKGKISCSGDSGGPLIFNRMVIGVCSYGFGCSGEYAVYENVFNHRDWIISLAGNETCSPSECSKLRSDGTRNSLAFTDVYLSSLILGYVICF